MLSHLHDFLSLKIDTSVHEGNINGWHSKEDLKIYNA